MSCPSKMMADKEDATPFLFLQSEAEKFKNIFDDDIRNCVHVLNSQITSLIVEPEFCSNPFGEPKRTMSTARMEFSKAKYDVFNNVKTMFKEMEDNWKKEIYEMKVAFLESLEIFLAGTKLEVKFPTRTEFSALAAKTSPESNSCIKAKKSPNSIYPSLHHLDETFTSVRQDKIRRKPFHCLEELPSSPALNLSPLKQNLCDIEEEEISDENDNITEFVSVPQEFPDKSSPRITRGRVLPTAVNQDFSYSTVADADEIFFNTTRAPKANARRKTMLSRLEDCDIAEINLTAERMTRTKSKRKTVSALTEDIFDTPAVSSPKRLKRSGNLKTRKSLPTAQSTPGRGFSLMECDEIAADKTGFECPVKNCYTPWVSLESATDLPPKQIGVYELKVWRAKKSAFIGCSDDLQQQLSLHKDGLNSGNKQLDKFLERNLNDIQVRYEVLSSIAEAKVEVKNRVKMFTDQHKTTPAYN